MSYVLCFMFYILYFIFYILYFIFYILYFIFYILYFIFYILYFIFYILYFIFYILYFIFYILYFIYYFGYQPCSSFPFPLRAEPWSSRAAAQPPSSTALQPSGRPQHEPSLVPLYIILVLNFPSPSSPSSPLSLPSPLPS